MPKITRQNRKQWKNNRTGNKNKKKMNAIRVKIIKKIRRKQKEMKNEKQIRKYLIKSIKKTN